MIVKGKGRAKKIRDTKDLAELAPNMESSIRSMKDRIKELKEASDGIGNGDWVARIWDWFILGWKEHQVEDRQRRNRDLDNRHKDWMGVLV